MKKELASVACAFVLLGATSAAFAGAYGEAVDREESPASVPVAAQAEPETAYWYVQAAALYSGENFSQNNWSHHYFNHRYGGLNADERVFFSPDFGNGWGYDVRGGRRLSEMFAVELEWAQVAGDFEAESDASMFPGAVYRADAETMALTVNGKFYPIKGNVQPFVLVGIGWEHVDVDWRWRDISTDVPVSDEGGWTGDGFVARFGLGVDYLITDSIGIAAEFDYLLPTGEIEDFDQIPVSLGIFYNFL
jgi:opacity protein-like surface antigen